MNQHYKIRKRLSSASTTVYMYVKASTAKFDSCRIVCSERTVIKLPQLITSAIVLGATL